MKWSEWKQNSKQMAQFVLSFSLLGMGSVVAVSGLTYWIFSRSLPRIISVADYQPRGVTQILIQDGKEWVELGEFFKERRYLVPFDAIPKIVIQAFLAAEDDRFFEHQGISPWAILRASIANFRAGQVVQGGSTITQQVAKSLFLTPERTLLRKVREAVLANRIENNLTKEQILYLYLNQIYLGHGAYGVKAAARVYFNKDVQELTLAEAALIASMPRAPSKYSPNANPRKAKEIQRYVLRRMFELGTISETQMLQSISEPLRIYVNDEENRDGLYVLENVRRYLIQKYGETAVYDEGLKVYLPSDMENLRKSRKALQKGLREVDKRMGYRGPIRNLGTDEAIAQFRSEYSDELMKKRVPYRILYPDGRLDFSEAAAEFGFQSEEDLFRSDELYNAVVVEVNDSAKNVRVAVGHSILDLPMENMKWARPYSVERQKPPEPQIPSQVVKRGDVVKVSTSRVEVKDPIKKQTVQKIVAILEQVPKVQGGLFSIEVETGNILAIEGGYEFEKSEFNRAVQAKRQPGSAFKPFIFSAAVERGYTPVSVIVDSPIVFKDNDFGAWKPTNFEEEFYGDTSFRMAFIKSRNIPTIKLVIEQGVKPMIEYSKRLGLMSEFKEDLSISLGSSAATLEELTKAYALFPRRGRKVSPISIHRVVNKDGLALEEALPDLVPPEIGQSIPMPEPSVPTSDEVVAGNTPLEKPMTEQKFFLPSLPTEADPKQVVDPRVAYVMTHLMREVVEFGTGSAAKSLGKAIAGKTGTTNDYRDAWFMGFSPHVATGVWVGYDDNQEIGPGETGARAALPIWMDFMQAVIPKYPESDFPVPAGVVFASIDMRNGKLIDASDPNARTEAFIAGTEPTERSRGGESQSVDSESEFIKEDF